MLLVLLPWDLAAVQACRQLIKLEGPGPFIWSVKIPCSKANQSKSLSGQLALPPVLPCIHSQGNRMEPGRLLNPVPLFSVFCFPYKCPQGKDAPSGSTDGLLPLWRREAPMQHSNVCFCCLHRSVQQWNQPTGKQDVAHAAAVGLWS